jgi:hypothetical protein
MPIDYTKDFMTAAERNSILQLQPASISGGGKAVVTGGGYVGVAFLPQRPIGGMVGRMSYGAECTPVFGGELLNLKGGSKKSTSKGTTSKKKDCDCEEKVIRTELQDLFHKNVDGMSGGSLVTQFSAISQVAPLFAGMTMNSIIAIIILIFGHSYALQYGESKKGKKSHKSKSMSGGGVPIFSQILIPLGMNNLIAIASLLLLHYFAVKRKKMEIGMRGGGIKSALQASIFENEMKIHEMIGGNKIYKSLQSIFLGSVQDPKEEIVGGKKMKKDKLEKAIAPLNKDQYIAIGIMNLFKSLFTNFYYTIYKNNKKSASYYSKKTYIFFKKIFDVIAPISVAIYLKKSKTKMNKK